MNTTKLIDVLNKETGTKGYDTTAEVRRIDQDGVVWVHIAGGVDETPVKMSVNAVVGDIVIVRVSNGQAYIIGNLSSPPTDDSIANHAVDEAVKASGEATKAIDVADNAMNIAGNTNQHFWQVEAGTDTGAHITEKPKEEFLDNPQNGGGNLLARSNGIVVRDGLAELAVFGASGAQIGQIVDGKTRSEINADGMRVIHRLSGSDVPIANLGYGQGYNEQGQLVTAPFFTLGRRAIGSAVGNNSTAEGENTTASGFLSHAEGGYTSATGAWSHAEGNATIASGDMSHAEGENATEASGTASHAEGHGTEASGTRSHAEGDSSMAQGDVSHAEGYASQSYGDYAHAEGYISRAEGEASHAEGCEATAEGDYSHAQNEHTRAHRRAQTAIGTWNKNDGSTVVTHPSGDASYGQYALIVGNGTGQYATSNALTVDWAGNVKATGDIADGHGFCIPFIAVYGVTTFAEITDAVNAGKMVFMKDNNNCYYSYIWTESSDKHWFGRLRANPIIPSAIYAVCYIDDTWDSSGKTGTRTISLGSLYTVGVMSGSGSTLGFSIPTGRIFPGYTTISKITFSMVARAGSSNGTGKYIIKSASGGSGAQAFDSSTTTKFYNATDAQKSLTSAMWTTKTIDGQTNVRIYLDSGSNYFFTGNATTNGYCNNQPVAIYLASINITFVLPS